MKKKWVALILLALHVGSDFSAMKTFKLFLRIKSTHFSLAKPNCRKKIQYLLPRQWLCFWLLLSTGNAQKTKKIQLLQ